MADLPEALTGSRINGGVGSVVAVFEEMTTAGTALATVSRSLTGYQRHLLLAQLANITSAPPRIPLLVPWWGAAMLGCAGRVGTLQLTAGKVQAQAALLATGLRRAQRAYATVELELARRFNELNKYPALLRAGTALLTGDRPTGADVEAVIENAPAYLGDLLYLASPLAFAIGSAALGPAGGLALSGLFRAGAVALPALRAHRYGGLFNTTLAERLYPSITKIAGPALQLNIQPVGVSALGPAQQQHISPDLAGMLSLVPHNEGAEAGTITVTTTTTADGSSHTIVGLPGTEGAAATEAAAGASPFGINGLAEATTLGSQHVTAGVLEALEEAGVPPGSAVSLVGFSQGGVHAVNVATDQRFSKKYRVGMIVTAGSPVAQQAAKLPSHTKTLHFEHRDDPVPGFDGKANPHSINRITVELTGYGPQHQDGALFGKGHNFANYLDRVGKLEAANPAGLAEHRAALAAALGDHTIGHSQGAAQGPGGPVTVQTRKVTLRHIPAVALAPTPAPTPTR